MSQPGSSVDRDPIDRLAESFLTRFRAGERPSIEEYAANYPELAEEIRGLLAALVQLEQNLAPEGPAGQSCVKRPEPDSRSGLAPRYLGDYLIVREVGRGGMGIVYEAVQQSLGRHVALKLLPAGNPANRTQIERFRLEARPRGCTTPTSSLSSALANTTACATTSCSLSRGWDSTRSWKN